MNLHEALAATFGPAHEVAEGITSYGPTATDRAAALVDSLQPLPDDPRVHIAQHVAALAAQEPLTVFEVPCVATDEEIAESAATMTAEEAADVAKLPTYIDCTPVGLQTPEGSARVAKAMQEWEDTHATVANAATQFADAHGADLEHVAEMYPELLEDWKELRSLMDDRSRKQEAFLRAVAGAPELAPAASPAGEEEDDTFGHASWCNEDIQTKAEELLGRTLTDEELETVRGSYAVRHITDVMIPAGWQAIEAAIADIDEEEPQKGHHATGGRLYGTDL
jgi:hypothetical protein